MEATPLVSVVIPTFNRARFLPQAIASVLDQTYRRIELLVADDGSTDDTAACVASFGDRLTYLRLEHCGRPEEVRNAGIQASHGELIAFLDDDDIWRPDKLAGQVAAFLRDETLGLAYTDVQLIYRDGSLSDPVLKPDQRRPFAVLDQLIVDCFIHPSTVVVHRRLFRQLGLFETRLLNQGDYYFWLRAAFVAPVCCIPEPLVLVRKHESNIADERGLVNYHNMIQLLEYLPAAIPLTSRQRLLCRRTLARHYTHIGLYHLQSGNRAGARRFFARSVTLYPLQRRAWLALASSLSPLRLG